VGAGTGAGAKGGTAAGAGARVLATIGSRGAGVDAGRGIVVGDGADAGSRVAVTIGVGVGVTRLDSVVMTYARLGKRGAAVIVLGSGDTVGFLELKADGGADTALPAAAGFGDAAPRPFEDALTAVFADATGSVSVSGPGATGGGDAMGDAAADGMKRANAGILLSIANRPLPTLIAKASE
jgi:hypothetical protein